MSRYECEKGSHTLGGNKNGNGSNISGNESQKVEEHCLGPTAPFPARPHSARPQQPRWRPASTRSASQAEGHADACMMSMHGVPINPARSPLARRRRRE